MRDEFPLVPVIMMVLTIGGCTAIGLLTGYESGDIVGLGIGLVLGITVFGVLSNLPTNPPLSESGFRFDEPHSLLRGPRQMFSRFLDTLRVGRW